MSFTKAISYPTAADINFAVDHIAVILGGSDVLSALGQKRDREVIAGYGNDAKPNFENIHKSYYLCPQNSNLVYLWFILY